MPISAPTGLLATWILLGIPATAQFLKYYLLYHAFTSVHQTIMHRFFLVQKDTHPHKQRQNRRQICCVTQIGNLQQIGVQTGGEGAASLL